MCKTHELIQFTHSLASQVGRSGLYSENHKKLGDFTELGRGSGDTATLACRPDHSGSLVRHGGGCPDWRQ